MQYYSPIWGFLLVRIFSLAFCCQCLKILILGLYPVYIPRKNDLYSISQIEEALVKAKSKLSVHPANVKALDETLFAANKQCLKLAIV